MHLTICISDTLRIVKEDRRTSHKMRCDCCTNTYTFRNVLPLLIKTKKSNTKLIDLDIYQTQIIFLSKDKAKFHYLVYVYSGEMLLEENGKEISVRAGQCIFIRRNHRVNFTKRTVGEEPFKSISLVFKRNFLRKYYQTFQSGNQLKNIKPLK